MDYENIIKFWFDDIDQKKWFEKDDNFEIDKIAYTGPGIIYNSKFLDNLKVPDESITKTIDILEKQKIGKKKINLI